MKTLKQYLDSKGWRRADKFHTLKDIIDGYRSDEPYWYEAGIAIGDYMNMGLELMDHRCGLVDKNDRPVGVLLQPYGFNQESLKNDNNLLNPFRIVAEELTDVTPSWNEDCVCVLLRKAHKNELK